MTPTTAGLLRGGAGLDAPARRLTDNDRFMALYASKGWTPEQAAETFGVSVSLVQAWRTDPESARYRAMQGPHKILLGLLLNGSVRT